MAKRSPLAKHEEVPVLVGLLMKHGVLPEDVGYEILGAWMNESKPRLSRLRAWVEDDTRDGEQTT